MEEKKTNTSVLTDNYATQHNFSVIKHDLQCDKRRRLTPITVFRTVENYKHTVLPEKVTIQNAFVKSALTKPVSFQIPHATEKLKFNTVTHKIYILSIYLVF